MGIFASNFYKLSVEEQKEISLRRLIKYIKEIVYPYHPFLRKLYKEKGIDVYNLRTQEDIASLPIIKKDDLRKDPLSFILQPKFPAREHLIKYDTERISPKFLLKYFYQAITNNPKEWTHIYRKQSFIEGKVGRRAAMEWFPIHFHASGGSTGEPTPVVYTYYELHQIIPELAAFLTILPDNHDKEKVFINWQTRNMNLFPGAPHLAFFQAIITKFHLGLSSFDTFGGKVIPTQRQIEIFYKGGFETLNAVPSYCVYWMRKATEMLREGKIGQLKQFKGLLVAAEPASQKLKEYLKFLAMELGAYPDFKIIEGYGMTECKWAFIECDEGTYIHLNPKYWYWEIIDPEGKKPVEEGKEGILVFSHIGWRGSVFIRYWTGDLIKGGIVWRKCANCGYTFPLLRGPIMRYEKDFTKIKGSRVELLTLIEIIRNTKRVRNFQIVIDKEIEGDEFSRDILKLRIATYPDADTQRVADDLKRNIKEETEVTPDEIIFEDGEKLERELFERTGIKADYVVDKRKRN